MSVKWRGKRLENHCAVAEAILEEANRGYDDPSSLDEAIDLLRDADARLDTIYKLTREIERMGMRMDDGLRDKGNEIDRLEEEIQQLEQELEARG